MRNGCGHAHIFYISVPTQTARSHKLRHSAEASSGDNDTHNTRCVSSHDVHNSAMSTDEEHSTNQTAGSKVHGHSPITNHYQELASPLSASSSFSGGGGGGTAEQHFSISEESEFSPGSYSSHVFDDDDDDENPYCEHNFVTPLLDSTASPQTWNYEVTCRPYVFRFLHEMSTFGYNLFVYTASNKNYATLIVQKIQQLFRLHYNYDLEFRRCLYRSDCIEKRHSHYLKDLTLFSEREGMSRVVLLDNNMSSGTFDSEGHLMGIESYYGETDDDELLKAAKWLQRLDMSEEIAQVDHSPTDTSKVSLYTDIPSLLRDYAKGEHMRKLEQRVTELFLS